MPVNPVLRLRQICLVAHDLDWTSNLLCTAFDARVVYRDPGMAAGGNLTNTHIRLGDSFLETVCPSDHAWKVSTTQTRLLERNGCIVDTWLSFKFQMCRLLLKQWQHKETPLGWFQVV